MKKILSFLCLLFFVFNLGITTLAVVDVPDAFGNDFAVCDINADGWFDVRDLVRTKKYIAGEPTVVNLKYVNDYTSGAELLVVMKQELLKGR